MMGIFLCMETGGTETAATETAATYGQYTLTVYVSPSRAGSVTKNPNKAKYAQRETVQLTATANAGYIFSNWSGNASGTSNPITITMNSNKTVTANFKLQYTLTVYVSPSGAGSVTKYPDKPGYAPGESVKLTAVPAANYCFYGWSGDVCGFWNPITIIMDGNKTVTALFRQKKCPKSPNPCGNL
jgi:uncharacterized repeat protein (TIGR02543 family)